MNSFARRDWNGRRECVGQRGVWYRGHDAQMFPNHFIVGNIQIVKLRAIVVADEAREMLKMLRLEFEDGGSGKAVRLLTTSNKRLAEETSNCFAPEEAKVAGTSSQTQKLFW